MDESPRLRAAVRQVEEWILAETGNQFERIVFLAADGSTLLAKDGDVGSVVLTAAEAALVSGRAVVITHNHPRGTTLSADDVLSAIDLGVREVHALAVPPY